MLSRSVLPLTRLRVRQPAARIATAIQFRSYSRPREFYLGDQGDYKLPSTASKPAWQQTSSFASKPPKEPLRRVPGTEQDLKFDESIGSEHRAHAERQALDQREIPSHSDSSAEFTRPPRPSRTSAEPPFDAESSEPDSVPRQPLPDLTKGIPSTLDAELGQTQSQRHSPRASLNITEDPSDAVAGEGEVPGDRSPRQEYISSSDRKKNAAVKYTYLILGLGVVGYAVWFGRNWDSEEDALKHVDAPSGWGFGLFYNRIKARLSSTMSYYNDPVTTKLLPDEEKDPAFRMPFTLVLSLEDMLVHQEWTRDKGWRIAKRPGLDYFLRYLSQYYELVLFTSQPSAMGDQVMRKLDPYMMVRWPLYREATLYKDGGYIKV